MFILALLEAKKLDLVVPPRFLLPFAVQALALVLLVCYCQAARKV